MTRRKKVNRAVAKVPKRECRRGGLAAEAAALMRDPAYVREARAVAALMERLSVIDLR